MCGFTGFLGNSSHAGNSSDLTAIAQKMGDAILHRGPDDFGVWCDENAGVALAHRRLSILELSAAGHQPMQSASSRYVIAFNGEIYNHQKIRAEIDSLGKAPEVPVWRGHSDTETLLAAIEIWGLEAALQKCIGMFSLALWDKKERVLQLARDRLGEKPLYYGFQKEGKNTGENVFLFGSELKALRAHPAFSANIRRDALSLYLRHNYIPAPHSIYEGIFKLAPASILTLSQNQKEPAIRAYWSVVDAAKKGVANRFKGTSTEAVNELEGLLKSAVSQQMAADVPLGAFLSGGVDSSAIVALMQAQSSRPVKTFTIGFNEAAYNEAEHAKAVAKHLGTEHTELYVSPEEAMAVIPKLPQMYDEPFADSSQIPTFLVSQLARQEVTVSLSGDAGDELFCGYNRYQLASGLWHKIAKIPRPLRSIAAKTILSVSPKSWDYLSPFIPKSIAKERFGDKLHKGAGVLLSESADDLYLGLVSHWEHPAKVVVGGHEAPTFLSGNRPEMQGLNAVERMMLLDAITYLPDDILTKVDRAAMAVSLETRVPLLDHRVVEFAWALPQHFKLQNGVSKWILREVLYKHVPKNLIERPKMGFGIPIDAWLRGALREWAEDLLSEIRLKREGFFHPEPIRQKWAEHLSGERNWAYYLWDILMFQAWLEAQKAS